MTNFCHSLFCGSVTLLFWMCSPFTTLHPPFLHPLLLLPYLSASIAFTVAAHRQMGWPGQPGWPPGQQEDHFWLLISEHSQMGEYSTRNKKREREREVKWASVKCWVTSVVTQHPLELECGDDHLLSWCKRWGKKGREITEIPTPINIHEHY